MQGFIIIYYLGKWGTKCGYWKYGQCIHFKCIYLAFQQIKFYYYSNLNNILFNKYKQGTINEAA